MQTNIIPKIIHYCWFGGKMPKKIKKNINKWKKILFDYEFLEWNEENFNCDSNEFVKQAYINKKWAFVADYARLTALYKYGGVYLDTDVEILKKFDDLLIEPKFIISQESNVSLCTAVMISPKENNVIKGFLDSYIDKKFIVDGKYNVKPNSELIKEYLSNLGYNFIYDNEFIDENIHILPQTYLCGKNIYNYKLIVTENTYCIHQLDASWYGPFHKIMKKCKKIVMKILNVFRK